MIEFTEIINYNVKYAIAGNALYLVEKKTGVVKGTGTAYPVQYYIDECEAKKDRNPEKWTLYIYDAPSVYVLKTLSNIKQIGGIPISS